jgi:hypothetical protein
LIFASAVSGLCAGVLAGEHGAGLHPPPVDGGVVRPRLLDRRADGGVVQPPGDGGDPFGPHGLRPPVRRDARQAPAGTGELAGDGGGGVGVVAEVRGAQHGAAEVVGSRDRPHGRLERVDAVAGATDLRRLLASPRPLRDRADRRVEVAPLPEVGAEHVGGVGALDERGDHRARQPACVDGSLGRGASDGWRWPTARRPRRCRCASGWAPPPAASATRWPPSCDRCRRRRSRPCARSVTAPRRWWCRCRNTCPSTTSSPLATRPRSAGVGRRGRGRRCRGSTRRGTSPSRCRRSRRRPAARTARRRPCRRSARTCRAVRTRAWSPPHRRPPTRRARRRPDPCCSCAPVHHRITSGVRPAM